MPEDLPGVIHRMEARIAGEVTDSQQSDILWVSTFILLGLQYEAAFAQMLLKGVQKLKESSTYQMILAEGEAIGRTAGRAEGEAIGRAEEARRTILRIGGKRFGLPADAVRFRLETITAIEALETLIDRLLEVESWEELLT